MRLFGPVIAVCAILWGGVPAAVGQGDLAVHDTFQRYSPAVYTVSVEIPKNYILQNYNNTVSRLRGYLKSYSSAITGGASPSISYNAFQSMVEQVERDMEYLKERMIVRNQKNGAAFAVTPHHLVTLSTVIKSATLGGDLTVYDNNRRQIKAALQGIDELTGVAVLRVDSATFSDYIDLDSISTLLPVASYVIAIQRPYDLPASPFSGMIGGHKRGMKLFKIERYIQTDLPLYPHNEGAPVFSPSGLLVGMIASEYHVGNWPGLTFIIPADIVADSAKSIIAEGKRERGWIPGLDLVQLESGILVEKLAENSPAAKAGLKRGDFIIEFNEEKETNVLNLLYKIFHTKPDETVSMVIQRGPNRIYLEVKTTLWNPQQQNPG